MKQVIVEINEVGEVEIETLGFKGSACERATKMIEDALGTPKSKKKKAEYYQSETKTTQRT